MRYMAGAIVFLTGGMAAYCQPSPAAVFDTASLKAAAPTEGRTRPFRISGGPDSKDPERFTAENAPFQNLVRLAYEIETYQLVGPDWMQTERYNLTAKVPAGATREQFRFMLQGLLAERFGLKIHWENKEMPIYELTVAKNGPKLRQAAPEESNDTAPLDSPSRIPVGADGYPVLPPGNAPMLLMTPSGKAVRRAYRETMDQAAKQLSLQTHRPVIDATGLKGEYNFTLHWVADAIGAGPQASTSGAEVDTGPDLFQAVQQQLGLKLEAKKGPVKVLFVDHAGKTPAEN